MKYLLLIAACLFALALAQNKIPGSDVVGMGYDGASLEVKGLPIVQNTWDPTNTWVNPLYPDLEYMVPLEFFVATDVEGALESGSVAYSSLKDYQNKVTIKKSSGGFFGFGKKSKTTEDFLRNFYQFDYSLSFSNQYVSWYSITLPPLPPPSMHPITQMAVDQLPAKYNSDPNSAEYVAYNSFISKFGTHYVNQAIMGGSIKMTSWYHRCFLSTYSEHWVTQQSGWSFLGIISSNSGSSNQNMNATALWNEYSEQNIEVLGGDSTVIKENNYGSWNTTVKYRPVAIDFQVDLIYNMITDDTRRDSMTMAVTDYFNKAAQDSAVLEAQMAATDPREKPSWCKSF